MTEAWAAVAILGAATIGLKGAGTVALGTRPLPAPAARVGRLLGPALLAALVVVQTVGHGASLTVDARAAGMAAAAVVLALRAPVLVATVVAAAVAAGARLLGLAA